MKHSHSFLIYYLKSRLDEFLNLSYYFVLHRDSSYQMNSVVGNEKPIVDLPAN